MKVSTVMPVEILRMALDSIRANKFRSFLTILGIVVGVMTAIVVASILTGMRNSIVQIVEDYGTNNIYAFHLTTGFGPSDRSERNRKPLTEADATAILAQSNAVEDIALVAPGIGNFGAQSFDDNMTYEGRNYRWAQTDGVSPNYDKISNLTLREGRFITEADDLQRRNVLVIGVNCADALFPNPEEGIVPFSARPARLRLPHTSAARPARFYKPGRSLLRPEPRRRHCRLFGKTCQVEVATYF
jgi:putative ABC transport system permease protein